MTKQQHLPIQEWYWVLSDGITLGEIGRGDRIATLVFPDIQDAWTWYCKAQAAEPILASKVSHLKPTRIDAAELLALGKVCTVACQGDGKINVTLFNVSNEQCGEVAG